VLHICDDQFVIIGHGQIILIHSILIILMNCDSLINLEMSQIFSQYLYDANNDLKQVHSCWLKICECHSECVVLGFN